MYIFLTVFCYHTKPKVREVAIKLIQLEIYVRNRPHCQIVLTCTECVKLKIYFIFADKGMAQGNMAGPERYSILKD